jgi:hypothetical protein
MVVIAFPLLYEPGGGIDPARGGIIGSEQGSALGLIDPEATDRWLAVTGIFLLRNPFSRFELSSPRTDCNSNEEKW